MEDFDNNNVCNHAHCLNGHRDQLPGRCCAHNLQYWPLPPGYRFHPTDEELITFYLIKKIHDPISFTHHPAIVEVDLNKCEPWDLPGMARMAGEKEWYFYSMRDRKYPSGVRTNRATDAGYWKATGKDRHITSMPTAAPTTTDGNGQSPAGRSCAATLVGMKKTLVFYRGRAPRGNKTEWVMHEYRLEPTGPSGSGGNSFSISFMAAPPKKDDWVICRVFNKNFSAKSRDDGRHNATNNILVDHHSLSFTQVDGHNYNNHNYNGINCEGIVNHTNSPLGSADPTTNASLMPTYNNMNNTTSSSINTHNDAGLQHTNYIDVTSEHDDGGDDNDVDNDDDHDEDGDGDGDGDGDDDGQSNGSYNSSSSSGLNIVGRSGHINGLGSIFNGTNYHFNDNDKTTTYNQRVNDNVTTTSYSSSVIQAGHVSNDTLLIKALFDAQTRLIQLPPNSSSSNSSATSSDNQLHHYNYNMNLANTVTNNLMNNTNSTTNYEASTYYYNLLQQHVELQADGGVPSYPNHITSYSNDQHHSMHCSSGNEMYKLLQMFGNDL